MLIVAGLLARKARALGLKPPSWVKTSLGPGSRAAAKYLGRSGLLDDLEALGFGIVGFGCTTCIGNSGPLVPGDGRGDRAARRHGGGGALRQPQLPRPGAWADRPCLPRLSAAGGRLRHRRDGRDRHFPRADRPRRRRAPRCSCAMSGRRTTRSPQPMPRRWRTNDFSDAYADNSGGDVWTALDAPTAAQFPWDPDSTYLRRPPFVALPSRAAGPTELVARPLIVLGDDITTDHISPAGAIPAKGEAGAVADRARRESARPQRLLLSPRQLRGDGPRPLHQPRGAQPARAGRSARLDAARALGRPTAALSRGRTLPRRGNADGDPRRPALRLRLLARLGREGSGAARGAGGAGAKLRAHPPLEPDRDGHPAARAARRPAPGVAGARGRGRDRLHHRLCARSRRGWTCR